jgi:hypothetical protein
MEFEPVSLASARATYNSLPSGVENMLDRVPGYWHRMRRPVTKRDMSLIPLSLEWMRTLPKEIWPLQTGASYPRVLNQIAQVWHESEEREAHFELLLNSPRKNRRGFPPAVQSELQALRLYARTL